MADDKKLPADSHAHKVVSTEGIVKGIPFWRKLARIFVTDDPETTFKNIATQVVEPNIKKGLVDAFAMLVLKRPVTGSGPANFIANTLQSGNSSTPYYIFGNNAQPQNVQRPATASPVTGGTKFEGSVYFNTWDDADDVLQELNRILGVYKMVRLLELYEAADIAGSEYVSNNWGWTDLTGSCIVQYGDGWILQLPPVKPLN